MNGVDGTRAVVLVEGTSDQRAVLALARRRGWDLAAERIAVVPMGGATNVARFLARYGPGGADLKLAGLYDSAEVRWIRRGLVRAGMGIGPRPDDLERLGFFGCQADLEDELIRALGTDEVERVIESAGDLGSFRTLQKQPAQQGRTVEAQLRRFMGTRGGRKIQYATLLVEALRLDRVPRPLDRVLAAVTTDWNDA